MFIILTVNEFPNARQDYSEEPLCETLTLFPEDAILDYSIRESRKARTVRLNMTPHEGLVVVIPAGFNRKRVPAIVEEKREWIERTRVWAEEQRRLLAAKKPPTVPAFIDLRAVGETWSVKAQDTCSARITAREHADYELLLSGPVADVAGSLDALGRWSRRKAREYLVPWLTRLSRETGLEFSDTRIGNQRSLWASCSPRGTISLNQKLIFLPEELVRYVLIHELCHTAHMNHSKRFWSRVRRHEPDCRELRRELGNSWRLVPEWLDR